MLAVRAGMHEQQFVERTVALGDQAVTPGFELVQRGGLAVGLLAVAVEHGANGGDFLVFEAPQQLGQVLGLAFACDRLRNRAGTADLLDQCGFERNADQLGV